MSLLELIGTNRRIIILIVAIVSFVAYIKSKKVRNWVNKWIHKKKVISALTFTLIVTSLFHFITKGIAGVFSENEITLAISVFALIIALMALSKE